MKNVNTGIWINTRNNKYINNIEELGNGKMKKSRDQKFEKTRNCRIDKLKNPQTKTSKTWKI